MKSFLFILISFVAVTALLSGFIMISNPDGEVLNLSVGLLKGTPFRDFRIPGILLTALIGITNSVATLFVIIGQQKRYNWTLAGGILLCGWVIAQIAMIDIRYWLHLIYLTTGILIILVSLRLKGKDLI
ncbi:MAG: hypothetical protein Q8939_16990 [Bacteroidota bacterium]|nr:hypothetical protein [Bacteroidota bacterium]